MNDLYTEDEAERIYQELLRLRVPEILRELPPKDRNTVVSIIVDHAWRLAQCPPVL